MNKKEIKLNNFKCVIVNNKFYKKELLSLIV